LFEVPASSFMPRPKVDSSVIRLDVRPAPAVHSRDDRLMFRLIRMAFNQRRKTILNALSSGMGMTKEQVSGALGRAGIPLMERGEKLTLEDYARLTDVF
jgi:16S rRNA (adenine1518-N6/adenine1519-N6)-dimethyltransferase